MTYYVTYSIKAHYVAEVSANSLEEAKEKAKATYRDADLGELQHIENEPIMVENGYGEVIWENKQTETLIDYIIKYEFYYYRLMSETKILFGEESNDFKFWNAKWSVFYNLARKFDFVDKLKR